MFLLKNWARKDFAHEVHTFWDNASRCLSFPNSVLHQVHPENFLVCAAEAFNPNSSTFRRTEFIGSESGDTQPWTFSFFRIATAP